MHHEAALMLYCPQCRELAEAVADGKSLVCLACGWKFDEKTAAKFFGGQQQAELPAEPVQAAR